jgi:hypothetical protein
MPSQHRYRAITPRPPDELRERAQAAVAEVGSDLNAHVIAFLRWLVGDTDELPARPDPHRPQDGASPRGDL